MSTWRPLPEKRSEREPQKVSVSLDRLARRLGTPGSDVLGAVFSRWEQLVGEDISAHSRPVSLRQGVLVLAVDHPAWATQLRFMTGDLLSRIEEVTGGTEVTDIRIQVGHDTPGEKPQKRRR